MAEISPSNSRTSTKFHSHLLRFQVHFSVRNLVPEALDLVPGFSFSCSFSSWGILVLSWCLARLFSSHLVPRACFRNCFNFNVVNILKKLPKWPNFGLKLLFGVKISQLLEKIMP